MVRGCILITSSKLVLCQTKVKIINSSVVILNCNLVTITSPDYGKQIVSQDKIKLIKLKFAEYIDNQKSVSTYFKAF